MNPGTDTPVSLRRLISIRVSLLTLFTTLLVTAVMVWFGLLPMADKIAHDQFEVTRIRVQGGLDAVFVAPVDLLAMSRGWVGGQAPELDSSDAFNRIFQPVLESSRSITSVVAGTSDGQGWLLLQRADGSWRNRMTDVVRWGARQVLTDRLADGTSSTRDEQQDYDPRQRPWFQVAMGSAKPELVSWTQPYTFFTTGAPGITAATLMRLNDGRDFVIGFDLLLSDVSQSTSHAGVASNGLALVVTQDERVLALPARPTNITQGDWQKRVLLPVAELGLAPVSAAFADWRARGRPIDGVLSFDSEGARWLATIRPDQLSNQYFGP